MTAPRGLPAGHRILRRDPHPPKILDNQIHNRIYKAIVTLVAEGHDSYERWAICEEIAKRAQLLAPAVGPPEAMKKADKEEPC